MIFFRFVCVHKITAEIISCTDSVEYYSVLVGWYSSPLQSWQDFLCKHYIQPFCVGFRNVIVLHILKRARVSGGQIIAYSPHHQTSFCFIISSQTVLPTSSVNRPRSQRSWLSHLSILNVLAWAGGTFALNSNIVA